MGDHEVRVFAHHCRGGAYSLAGEVVGGPIPTRGQNTVVL
jgi:hypothetical protein